MHVRRQHKAFTERFLWDPCFFVLLLVERVCHHSFTFVNTSREANEIINFKGYMRESNINVNDVLLLAQHVVVASTMYCM